MKPHIISILTPQRWPSTEVKAQITVEMNHECVGKFNGHRISYIKVTPNNKGQGKLYPKTIMNIHKEVHFVREVDDSLSAGNGGSKWVSKLRGHRYEICNSTVPQ